MAEYVGEVGVTPAVAVMLIAPLPFVLISELFTTILPGYWIWSLEDQYLLWLGVVVFINIYTIFDRERHHPLTIFAAGVGVRFGFLFLAGLLVTVVVGLPVISFGEFLGGAFSLAFVEAVVAEYVEEWSVEVTSVVTVVLIAPLVLVVIGEWFTRPGVVGYWIGNPQDQYLLWLGVVMAVGSYAIFDRMEAEMEKMEEKMEKEESESQQTEKSGRDNINRDDQQHGQIQSNQDLREKFERLYRERKQQ